MRNKSSPNSRDTSKDTPQDVDHMWYCSGFKYLKKDKSWSFTKTKYCYFAYGTWQ